MEVFNFNLMPWPYLPADYSDPAWVTCPNALYDPMLGHQLYNDYLDQLEYSEELGFDGVVINEHHQTAYGGMPSPNVVAGMLARRTSKVKIAVMGAALPLYNPPLRVAEEYALLDVVTGGRLIAGMVLAAGPEYLNFGIKPTEARARFNEALELILQAWTRPGPFEFNGRFNKVKYVNPWPRPIQTPHPPIWIPGAGSLETIELVSRHGFGYAGIPFFDRGYLGKTYQTFRRKWQEAGRAPDPGKMALLMPIFVGESDRAAREQFEPHMWYFVRKLINGIGLAPPGYMSPESTMRMMASVGSIIQSAETWDDIDKGEYVIVGSPETVTERLSERIAEIGAGNLYAIMQFGSMPNDMVRRNLELFSEEVLPSIRKEFPAGAPWPKGE